MILMCTGTYPLTSAMKAADVFLENASVDPIPDYIDTLGFYTQWGGDGIVFYLILDVEDGKVDDGVRALTKRFVNYKSVEGYKVEIQVVLPIAEALAAIGKEAPAA